MSRLFETVGLSETTLLPQLAQGSMPRLSLPHLPLWLAAMGCCIGWSLATPTESHAANGRVVYSGAMPTGAGCVNCARNRNQGVVTHSSVPSSGLPSSTIPSSQMPSSQMPSSTVHNPVVHSSTVHNPTVHGSNLVGSNVLVDGQIISSSQPTIHSSQPITSSNVIHSAPVQANRASYAAPSHHGGPVSNVLSTLNAQRSRQGLRSLAYDPQLQAVAQRRAQQMAASGLKTHPSGSFAPGRYEGVGWSSSYSPRGVSACYTSDPNMRVAGAAMARGRDGVYFCVVYR
ncbi:CAP domain-containing protein [Rhodopirellula sp. JC740]|uniref:CAP domain-containing protein n=1 Tax=Rhodopirellula halodulae TaxID=2894198 RepID=A0ABS8NGJ9_9BACT|nr:CAP domain-containing protein [Rhodopirellula sp. JC740]MCC9642680.1 CAP domain-containing protein [Rhodopirellula sp. JC740]